MLAGSRKEWRMDGALGPLDPLELALLLEAAEDLSGLEGGDPPPVDEEAEDGDEDDQEL
jgi:hypothetical protein